MDLAVVVETLPFGPLEILCRSLFLGDFYEKALRLMFSYIIKTTHTRAVLVVRDVVVGALGPARSCSAVGINTQHLTFNQARAYFGSLPDRIVS